MTRSGAGFGWNRFPHYLIAAMLVVVAVNVRFITIAVRSFPGEVTKQDFETSNHYDAVLERAAAQAALGYKIALRAEPGQLVLALRDRAGAAVGGAAISATIRRPLGDPDRQALHFAEIAPGQYRAAAAPGSGQWDVDLVIGAGTNRLVRTERVVLP